MALESASWISELDTTNPPGTDKKKQGDDHLRLIKTVIKAVFPNASKAFYFPTTASSQTANFSVTAAQMHKVFPIDTTGGAVTASLPNLAVGDAGWECSFVKTNTGTNPYFIIPNSGTLRSGDQVLGKTRRCIPSVRTKAFWTGTIWIVERVVNVPIGTILDIPRSLPVGYEFANGQTLASAIDNYPDFYAANGNSGVVTDRCGRAAFGAAMGLSTAATRLDGVVSATMGNVGGAAKNTIAQTHLPSMNLTISSLSGTASGTLSVSASGEVGNQFFENFEDQTVVISGGPTGTNKKWNGAFSQGNLPNNGIVAVSGTTTGSLSVSSSGTVALGGGGTALPTLPPAITTNFMVVVE